MRILVTGGRGFIGTHLRKELRGAGHQVLSVDLADGFDLRTPGVLAGALAEWSPEWVVHLAAKVGRLFGEDDPAVTIADNATMTASVARACGERGVRLCYASTSEVYGDLAEQIAVEGAPLKRLPHNLYGLSKRWGEEVAQLYAPDGLVILRPSMPYGPGLPVGRGRAAIVNFLDMARRRVELPVHRGGERSWNWIGDAARGIRMILELESNELVAPYWFAGTPESAPVWNVGRDDAALPMLEVAALACELTGAPASLVTEVDAPQRQTVVKRLSTAKLRSIGWKPEVDLREGMTRTLRWLEAGCPAL